MSKISDKKSVDYDRLFAAIEEINNTVVSVGIHEAEGSAAHEGDDTWTLSVADIMGIHEFGAPESGIPERSWLRGWADENQDDARAFLTDQIGKSIASGAPIRRAFERAGLRAVGQIQKRIARRIAPALKPATIKRKGSSVPLIDSGQGRQAITYKVGERGTTE